MALFPAVFKTDRRRLSSSCGGLLTVKHRPWLTPTPSTRSCSHSRLPPSSCRYCATCRPPAGRRRRDIEACSEFSAPSARECSTLQPFSAFGAAPMLDWLLKEKQITQHVSVLD